MTDTIEVNDGPYHLRTFTPNIIVDLDTGPPKKVVGYISLIDLGLFTFPCAYQELDLEKLDRNGLYELSFWVKGSSVSTGGPADSAQIKAGIAFNLDSSASKIADAECFDLVGGSIGSYKGGQVEIKDGYVKIKAKFTINGSGTPLNGTTGINEIDNCERIFLYVGTPDKPGSGTPPNYVLYDFITIKRLR